MWIQATTTRYVNREHVATIQVPGAPPNVQIIFHLVTGESVTAEAMYASIADAYAAVEALVVDDQVKETL